MAAQKEAVNESPAPTVSATFTLGVSWNDVRHGEKTYEPLVPQVRTLGVMKKRSFNVEGCYVLQSDECGTILSYSYGIYTMYKGGQLDGAVADDGEDGKRDAEQHDGGD